MPIKTFLFVCLLFGGWKLYSHQQAGAEAGMRESYQRELAQLPNKKGITIFTATWCGYCDKLKASLDASAVPYTEYDIEKSPQGRMYGEASQFNGVPIIVVDGKTVLGYDMRVLPATFSDAGYNVNGF
ncbi:MAG: glutaredoxin family protein [Pseudomonadota bacterium]